MLRSFSFAVIPGVHGGLQALTQPGRPRTVPGMNKTVIALMAALAGSLGTWAILHNKEEPPAAPAKAPGLTGSNAKVRALENEVAQLRDQLAKQKKESAQFSAAVKEPADAARNIATLAREREREEMVKRRREAMEKRVEEKMERLTTKLNLTPEQAQSTKEWQ